MDASIVSCACGCGTEFQRMDKWGRPRRFAPGHQAKERAKFQAGVTIINGYRNRKARGHHRATTSGYIPEHLLLAEKALGRPLPAGAEVHHGTGDSLDNSSLVICQDRAYHKLLHARMRLRAAGGNPNTDKICGLCRAVKPKTDFGRAKGHTGGLNGWCRECTNKKAAEARGRRPAA